MTLESAKVLQAGLRKVEDHLLTASSLALLMDSGAWGLLRRGQPQHPRETHVFNPATT